MALLHYQNLEQHRPDILMNKVFYGLKGHNDYLKRIIDYLKDEEHLRLAVREVDEAQQSSARKKQKNTQEHSVWLDLMYPEDLNEASDKVIEAFLDSDVKSVYETDPAEEASKQSSRRQSKENKFARSKEIRVLGRDAKNERLHLERMPVGDILLRPNTYTLQKQLEAVWRLQNSPSQAHRPLLRLFENNKVAHSRWPRLAEEVAVEDWKVLTDTSRPGAKEQRKFVEIALRTPDFALLEGPPGSGKTTAICELILQLITQGKRVLLCASTHVAVDNVIERLMDEDNQHRHLIIPVRIGSSDRVSERIFPWTLEQFVKTESSRIKAHLHHQENASESQLLLKQNMQNNPALIERLVLESANLVCGTTIGFLKHPDIKKGKSSVSPEFDVMIIDEASKTTFQEFLVPALYAKRWILVGDPKQLSPYVDDQELALNIAPCIEKSVIRNACVDVFLAEQRSEKKRRVAVVEVPGSGNQNQLNVAEIYKQQAGERTLLKRAQPYALLGHAAIVVGTREELKQCEEFLPLDATTFRFLNDPQILPCVERRAAALVRRKKIKQEGLPAWENEVAWRQARLYEQRFAPKKQESEQKQNTLERLQSELKSLLPVNNLGGLSPEKVEEKIDSVRRIALPSVLESLRLGFERSKRDRNGTALTDGLPDKVLSRRRVLLSYQHRMHPEIAQFPHEYIYHKQALNTPSNMVDKRRWGYTKYENRVSWHDVKGIPGKKTSNAAEADVIMKQLEDFDTWAEQSRNNGSPWEVAILCFYRGQEYELQQRLKKWTGSNSKRYFKRGAQDDPYLSVQLCTVDRFQGHEADLVFLSFSNDHITSFLESPNRLNVALTRARYQLVILGNRKKFESSLSLVGKLVKATKWGTTL